MQDDRIELKNPKPTEETGEAELNEVATPQSPDGKGKAKRKRKQSLPGKIMTGEIFEESKVRSHYPFALYCCLLIIAYIAYVFNYQRLQRDEIRVKIELQEELSRSLIFSSMRMNASRHSNILREVESRGLPLIESSTPPRIIEVTPHPAEATPIVTDTTATTTPKTTEENNE